MTAKKKPPAKRRPSVLTPETKALYLRARRRGGNDTDCAYTAGFSTQTVRNWRSRLEMANIQVDHNTGAITSYADDETLPPITELFEFFEADKKARTDARLNALARIEEAANRGTWQAAAWLLERMYPDEFARRERRDITIITEEQVDAEIARLRAELGYTDL